MGRSLSMVTCVVGMVERGTCDSGGDGGGGGGGGGCGGDDSDSGEEGDEEGTGARAADGKEGRGGGRDGGGRSRGTASGDEGRRGGGAGRGRGTSNAPVSGAGPSNEEIGGKDGSCEHANSPPGWGMQRLLHAAAPQRLRQMVSKGIEVQTRWSTLSAPPSLSAHKQATTTQPFPLPPPPPRHCVQTRKRQPATALAVTLSAVDMGPVIPNQAPVDPMPRPQSHPRRNATISSCITCANEITDDEPHPGAFWQLSARAPARTSTSASAPRTSTCWPALATNAAKSQPCQPPSSPLHGGTYQGLSWIYP